MIESLLQEAIENVGLNDDITLDFLAHVMQPKIHNKRHEDLLCLEFELGKEYCFIYNESIHIGNHVVHSAITGNAYKFFENPFGLFAWSGTGVLYKLEENIPSIRYVSNDPVKLCTYYHLNNLKYPDYMQPLVMDYLEIFPEIML